MTGDALKSRITSWRALFAFAHHDVGEQYAVLTGRTDGRHTAALPEGSHRGGDVFAPERCGREDFGPVGAYGQSGRFRASAGDDQCVQAGRLESPGKTAAGGTVVDGAGQGRTGHDGKPGGGGGGGAAQGADGENQWHGRVKGVETVAVPHKAHAEAAAAQILLQPVPGNFLAPYRPFRQVNPE
jgi:hypothetical protein